MLSPFSHVQLFTTLWTAALQVPLSMGFSRQEYWSGLPCLPPGDLPDPGTKPTSPVSPALQVDSSLLGSPHKNHMTWQITFSLRLSFNIEKKYGFHIIFIRIQWDESRQGTESSAGRDLSMVGVRHDPRLLVQPSLHHVEYMLIPHIHL